MAETRKIQCPICRNKSESGRTIDYGERLEYDCARCGPYEITRTAVAMLSGRLEQDPKAYARLSHAIRSQTNEENRLSITSANLDELLNRPLPTVPKQYLNLLSWLASRLGDDHLGSVDLPFADHLAGTIGTADGDGVERLLKYTLNEGLIDVPKGDRKVFITPKGWSLLNDEIESRVSVPSNEGGPLLDKNGGQFTLGSSQLAAVPAVDRIVTLDHNSLQYQEAIDAIDRVIEAVAGDNEYGEADPEEKAALVGALKAGRSLLDATRVRILAVYATLIPSLQYVADNFAKGAIAALGASAVAAVMKLLGLL